MIRPNVLEMSPYLPGKPIAEVKRELGLDRVVKLASNENPFGPSPKAVEAVKRAAAEMHLYPDGAAHDLRAAIAERFDVPYEQVMVGNGSDELIHTLGTMFLSGPEDELLMGDPGFSRYDASAHLAAAKLVKVPLDADFRHDLDAMAAAATERTRLVYVANPNNPTGTVVGPDEFERFLDRLPPDATVVLDEAYLDFAAPYASLPDSRELVLKGRNVVALRTFSKAYGLAGIRVGFGFASPQILDAFHRAREPFNVNALAQAAAIAALDDDAHLKKTVESNREGLDRLRAVFESLGARVIDSYANFAYADLGQDATPVFQALLQRGVIVRAGAHVGHPHCLRVSVGTPKELDVFERELRSIGF